MFTPKPARTQGLCGPEQGQGRRHGEGSEGGGARRRETHVSAPLTFAGLSSRENELDHESEGLCRKAEE